MKVESITECSIWSILQYFWAALSNNWSWKPIFSSPEPKAHGWANSIPVTPASGVRPSVNIFKHLLWNHLANWTQISYEDSLGWGEQKFVQMVQDGKNPLKIFFSRTRNLMTLGLGK